ncbi:hypothetical protein J9N36_004364 [Salmonella enterica]|uniref:Uncharacterized protein n=1 Tax=Salmonella newport TaxID=108619 RepID=A0A5U9VS05_SALNE|nr:hypothetical protein [Salmonella enterica subsp. enterica serovar Newport]ECB3302179.1 hypothetical protein [Salmonella enterica subsp. enterica serovar Newport]EHI3122934.1 hypothetical protein [Salmonella enterica]
MNTATDAFCWLCLIESELLSIRAFQNTGLYTPYDKADEEPVFEYSVYNSGMACGEFLYGLEVGTIAPLTAAGKEMLDTLNRIGLALCAPVWEQAVKQGLHDSRADRAIYEAGADGWV